MKFQIDRETGFVEVTFGMLQVCLYWRPTDWCWHYEKPYADVPWWYCSLGPVFVAWD